MSVIYENTRAYLKIDSTFLNSGQFFMPTTLRDLFFVEESKTLPYFATVKFYREASITYFGIGNEKRFTLTAKVGDETITLIDERITTPITDIPYWFRYNTFISFIVDSFTFGDSAENDSFVVFDENRTIDCNLIGSTAKWGNVEAEEGELLIDDLETNTKSIEVFKDEDRMKIGKNVSIQIDIKKVIQGFHRQYVELNGYFYDEANNTFNLPDSVILPGTTYGNPTKIIAIYKEGYDTVFYAELDHKQIMIRDGFTINEELNETLDSGTFQFITSGKVENIEPFDSITFESIIVPHFERKKQLIDSYTAQIDCFGADLEHSDFSYLVNIFSETKLLERITCPNLKNTKRENGTNLTVFDVLMRVCSAYLPRSYYYDAQSSVYKTMKPIFKFDSALRDKLNAPCPEFSWNSPTLKEVLMDLFSVVDCIPVIKENVLTYFDLTLQGNEIDVTKLTNAEVSHNSADYCDEITMPMQNVIQINPTRVVEYVGVRTSEGQLETENGFFQTSKPIYKITKATLYAAIGYYDPVAAKTYRQLEHVDITNRIVERNDYILKSPKFKEWGDGEQNTLDFQIFYLYYERGKNNIPNVITSTEYRPYGDAASTNYARANLVLASALDSTNKQKNIHVNLHKFLEARKIFIKLEYETIDEATITVGKTKKIKNPKNVVFDGQKTSMIDLDHQSIHEYTKVNRLGNRMLTIYGEYFDEAEVPQLADHIGDKILFSRSLTYYDNMIMFKGQLVDTYILRDYFTSVLAKRRTYAIVSVDDASIRHDVYKFYVTACFSVEAVDREEANYYLYNETPYFAYGLFTTNLARLWMNLKYYFERTKNSADANYPSSNEYYSLDVNFSYGGNSIIIDAGYFDNLTAGYYINIDDDTYENNLYRYADQNGEFVSKEITLANYYDAGDGDFNFESYITSLSTKVVQTDWDTAKYNAVVNKALIKPKVHQNGIRHGGANTNTYMEVKVKNVYKDNRDIIKNTLQFEYCSDTDDIIIRDGFIKNSVLLNQTKPTVRFYYLEGQHFSLLDTVAKGVLKGTWSGSESIEDITIGDLTKSVSKIVINTDTDLLNDEDAWCIADTNDNILLAVNGNRKTIYFDVRYTRDDNVYNSQIDKKKIGSTKDMSVLVDEYELNQPTVKTIKVLGKTINVDDTEDFS